MNKGIKLFKLLAISALVLVVALLTVKLVRRTFFPKTTPADARARLGVGQKISIPGISWADNRQTLLLYLDKHCVYCKASAPFYSRLVQEAAGLEGVRVFAVLSRTTDDDRRFLNGLGLTDLEVVQAGQEQLRALPTPTLLLVNSEGVISGRWIGQQKGEGETAVLRRLREGKDARPDRDQRWYRWEN